MGPEWRNCWSRDLFHPMKTGGTRGGKLTAPILMSESFSKKTSSLHPDIELASRYRACILTRSTTATAINREGPSPWKAPVFSRINSSSINIAFPLAERGCAATFDARPRLSRRGQRMNNVPRAISVLTRGHACLHGPDAHTRASVARPSRDSARNFRRYSSISSPAYLRASGSRCVQAFFTRHRADDFHFVSCCRRA